MATFIGPAGVTAIASGGSYSAGEVAALTPATSLYGEFGHLWDIGGDATVKASVQASFGIKVRWSPYRQSISRHSPSRRRPGTNVGATKHRGITSNAGDRQPELHRREL